MSLTQSLVAPSERFGQLPDQAGTVWALVKIAALADTGCRGLGIFLTEHRGVFMTRDSGAVDDHPSHRLMTAWHPAPRAFIANA